MPLEYFNHFGTYYFISLVITFIIILIRIFKKKKVDSTQGTKIFFNVIALMSVIPLVYFMITDGEFLFGTQPKDLFVPIAVAIIFLVMHSVTEIKNFIRN